MTEAGRTDWRNRVGVRRRNIRVGRRYIGANRRYVRVGRRCIRANRRYVGVGRRDVRAKRRCVGASRRCVGVGMDVTPPLGCPLLQTSCAQLQTTFLRSGLTLQKPRLTPSAPLVPGLHSYDLDLTLCTN